MDWDWFWGIEIMYNSDPSDSPVNAMLKIRKIEQTSIEA